ncbi:PIG-L deacetylase family protein [Desulforamulus ruminis]|uniref:LmbE family protein n=1 Tax=Desulforamulus ruminis (strain ATCC 23193 / DSM 2154 / NCIMB 8452 / DL) TaxID=696281 RepID=F6DNQ2_DESRL|nr:PIG-L deacetylase family protein [Desulforamulus ruminis]AEG59497.1 LmbE family protein [Desulforamulus ruminis DSM 2154]
MSKKILVIAAHPDDEVLGCGATIAKHSMMGDAVHVAILAEGATSRGERYSRDKFSTELSELNQAAHNASQILGVSSLELFSFPDNRMDSLDRLDIIKKIENLIDKYKPLVVYTHHIGDVNIDHRRIHEAVVTACRPTPNHPVKTLLFFEVPSSTEWQLPGTAPKFEPNWFEDVTDSLHIKIDALKEYRCEMRPWPHARSMEAVEYLARWRGASIGVKAAEAFILGRNILGGGHPSSFMHK